MKSLFNKYIWLQLILSILLLFGGALIIVFAATGNSGVLREGLNIIAAVTLFLFGLFAILTAFIFEPTKPLTNGLLYGSACIALGVFLCIRDFFLLDYLVLLLAIFFIVIGSVELVKGIFMLVNKYKDTKVIIFAFAIAAIFITGGILAIIFRAKMVTAFCIIAGVLLVIAGVYELVMGIKVLANQNKNKSQRRNAKKTNNVEKKENIKELDYTK